jgi:hypothetical protein
MASLYEQHKNGQKFKGKNWNSLEKQTNKVNSPKAHLGKKHEEHLVKF